MYLKFRFYFRFSIFDRMQNKFETIDHFINVESDFDILELVRIAYEFLNPDEMSIKS